MSGQTIYTFAPLSVSFTRETGEEFQPWFFPETQYTADPTLAGTHTYVDIGGDTPAPLSFRASCASAVDRQTLKNGRKAVGVLSNTRGRTATVLLVKATPVDSAPYTQYLIDLTFVLVSS